MRICDITGNESLANAACENEGEFAHLGFLILPHQGEKGISMGKLTRNLRGHHRKADAREMRLHACCILSGA